jgi:hypothetical protein
MVQTVLERYAGGAGMLAAAIQDLTRADFLATPVPGTWSIQQIVIHLMDSDLIASDRMKRIIAEENPTLVGFDESAFAAKLFYDKLDPLVAAEVFQKNRELTAVILRSLPAGAFERVGMHSERGALTLGKLLTTYTEHLEHHLKFVREKRALLGKALAT